MLRVFYILLLIVTLSFAETPKEKVDKMVVKAWEYYEEGRFIKMEKLSRELLEYSLKHNIPKGIAEGYYYLGVAYFSMGNKSKALEYANKAVEYSIDKDNYRWKAYSHTLVGEIMRDLKKYKDALKHFKIALDLAEKNGNKKMLPAALANIGNIYFEKGELNKAVEYYRRGLKIAKEINLRKSYIALNSYNLGITYYRLKKYSEAVKFLKEALNIYNQLKDTRSKINSAYFLAKSYIKSGEKNNALKVIKDNLQDAEKLKVDYKFLKLLRKADKI